MPRPCTVPVNDGPSRAPGRGPGGPFAAQARTAAIGPETAPSGSRLSTSLSTRLRPKGGAGPCHREVVHRGRARFASMTGNRKALEASMFRMSILVALATAPRSPTRGRTAPWRPTRKPGSKVAVAATRTAIRVLSAGGGDERDGGDARLARRNRRRRGLRSLLSGSRRHRLPAPLRPWVPAPRPALRRPQSAEHGMKRPAGRRPPGRTCGPRLPRVRQPRSGCRFRGAAGNRC